MLTRGRLVPRQPRAIKGTTRTELRGESIHSGEHIHWNINITPTLLRSYNIQNSEHIHWNINITPTLLRGYNIQNSGYIHLEYWYNNHSVAWLQHLQWRMYSLEYWHKTDGIASL